MKMIKIMSSHTSLNALARIIFNDVRLILRPTEIMNESELPKTEEWFDHVAR